MIQLTFQASLDPFHAIFRQIRLIPIIRDVGELSVDHVRIIDFYLTFPFRIDSIRLKPNHRGFRRLAKLYNHVRPYGQQPDDELIFNRMEPFQIAGMETLAAHGLLNGSRLKNSWISPTEQMAPEQIAQRAADFNTRDRPLLDFLSLLANEYTLTGIDGLKHRTGLMEYRYDIV